MVYGLSVLFAFTLAGKISLWGSDIVGEIRGFPSESSKLIIYYDNLIEKWSKKRVDPCLVFKMYSDEIGWNLNIQLSWVAVFLSSFLGLLQIISREQKFTLIYAIIFYALTWGIDISLGQVLKQIQTNLRDKQILDASIRIKKKLVIPLLPYNKLSFYQKHLLRYPLGKPTLKKL